MVRLKAGGHGNGPEIQDVCPSSNLAWKRGWMWHGGGGLWVGIVQVGPCRSLEIDGLFLKLYSWRFMTDENLILTILPNMV